MLPALEAPVTALAGGYHEMDVAPSLKCYARSRECRTIQGARGRPENSRSTQRADTS